MSSKNKMIKRNPDGTIKPGTALNPGGRPKGIERRVRELVESRYENWDGRTLDGWEAITYMMFEIAMGRKPAGDLDGPITMKDRIAAAGFLWDRAYGKPKIQIESDTTLHAGKLANLDPDKLSSDELDALEAHVEALAAKAAGKATSNVLDIDPADIVEVDES